jgi:hypothetical protein
VFWLGLKGFREEVIRQTPMGCTTLKTLNDYHSSLIQKKKKHPIKEKETNAKSMFLSHGHEEGEKKRSGLESHLISFSKSYKGVSP